MYYFVPELIKMNEKLNRLLYSFSQCIAKGLKGKSVEEVDDQGHWGPWKTGRLSQGA